MILLKLIKRKSFANIKLSHTIKYYLTTTFSIFLVLIVPSKVYSDTAIISKESGGSGGAPFIEMAAPSGVISKITIRSGKFIDGIQLTYRYKHQISSKLHGGLGGLSKTFILNKGEYITELGGRSGKYVDSIYIKTNRGRIERWGGNGGQRSFKFLGTNNAPIQGIWGRSGSLLDAIGVIKKSSARSRGSQKNIPKIALKAFKPIPNKIAFKGGSCDKCDSYTNPIFPTLNDLDFWKSQNEQLYGIAQRIAKSPTEFNSYIKETEYQHCQGHIFCEIDTRTDLLFKVLGAK
jgi:hypothetical protein